MTPPQPDPSHAVWARFRFAIIGPLLASPPDSGELQAALDELATKTWRHPLDGTPMKIGRSTLERWFYQARNSSDPIVALRPKVRADSGRSRVLSDTIKTLIRTQYRQHPAWSYQLHYDNLQARVEQDPELGSVPSYPTVRRYMKAHGLIRHKRLPDTEGGQRAERRLQQREVRSYEVEHVNALWHLDVHHGSRQILTAQGQWKTPLLLAIMDDRSRLIAHAQWYLDETTPRLVHGFSQALMKRGLPRAVMTDNGSAMTSEEFTQGLSRLSILHQPTLPHCPHQNGKQESFWGQVEGRLMAMLEGQAEVSLRLLNDATWAWIEGEYHRKVHAETAATPLDRFLEGPNVTRPSPSAEVLRRAFRMQAQRKQRRSDGTISIHGVRFEIPSAYRHCERVHIRYARWDLSQAEVVDAKTHVELATIYPLHKTANARGMRRAVADAPTDDAPRAEGIAPRLEQLIRDFAQTGRPAPYLPTDEEPS